MAKKKKNTLELNKNKYTIFGKEFIEQPAIKQMDIAMTLPVSVGGALMPDAHPGYGLPIGGVLAVDNAVIPYGVGVDIGCRMALSIYQLEKQALKKHDEDFHKAILKSTLFGAGRGFKGKERSDHKVLENSLFRENKFLAKLKDKAWSQLGTSGGGNHFVEFGLIDVQQYDNQLNLPTGVYIGLLTHSGSRGLGATIADYYTRLAKSLTDLPREAHNLAYLSLDSQEGRDYWQAMQLAGQYASACHEVIHQKISSFIGEEPIAKVENHHNFAWKEQWNGREVIVHRKGATPAAKGVLGFIPGSMATPGYLVRGKGEETSIHSAAHGAGRLMSRKEAIQTFDRKELNRLLEKSGISLIGSGMDEVPMAYKDIRKVMNAQKELVEVVGVFEPKIVRMADDSKAKRR